MIGRMLCRIGLHRWSAWGWSKFTVLGSRWPDQVRRCQRCKRLEIREL